MTSNRVIGRLLAGMATIVLVAGCNAVDVDDDTGRRAGTGAAVGAAAGAAVGVLSGGFLAKTVAGAVIGGAGGFIYDQVERNQ